MAAGTKGGRTRIPPSCVLPARPQSSTKPTTASHACLCALPSPLPGPTPDELYRHLASAAISSLLPSFSSQMGQVMRLAQHPAAVPLALAPPRQPKRAPPTSPPASASARLPPSVAAPSAPLPPRSLDPLCTSVTRRTFLSATLAPPIPPLVCTLAHFC